MAGWILAVILMVAFLLALPLWPYSLAWGYLPSGLLGILFLVVLILALAAPGWWRRKEPRV